MKKEKITSFSDFMYYYKWHIIALVIAAVLLAFLVRDCSTKVEDDMAVTALLSNYSETDSADKLEMDFIEAELVPDFNEDGVSKVYVNLVTVPLEPKDEMDAMGAQRAMLALAADDSILFLVDEDLLEMYEEQNTFSDVGGIASELGIAEDMLYTDENGTIIGISLKDNEYLESRGIVTETLYACHRFLPQDEDVKEAKLRAANDILKYIVR